MTTIIFSTVLNKTSKTAMLAKTIHEELNTINQPNSLIYLDDLDLPMCDGYHCYQHKQVIKLQKQVQQATSVIFCSPIYCYDLNAIAKNLIELIGQQLTDKVAAVAVTAGGSRSYMAPLSFINSLMIDFRCLVIPRFVYVESNQFNNNNTIKNSDIKKRISQLVTAVAKYSNI